MAHIQYIRNVSWDTALSDLGLNESGLVITALKTTSGAPTATAGKFAIGAIVQNTATGVLYVNTGTTASPVFSIIDSNTGGLPSLADGKIWAGNASNVATAVTPSGDATMSNTGVITVGAGKITGAKLSTGVGYFTVAQATDGTTPVDVIAATVPFACTITGVYLISLDTTAGNITIADTAGTVATIAKGTSAGVMVGADALANTSVANGDVLTIVSSSAGNARVFITFTVA